MPSDPPHTSFACVPSLELRVLHVCTKDFALNARLQGCKTEPGVVLPIQQGFKVISPFIVPSFIMNSGSGVAAVELDAQGPNYCIGGYGGEGTGGAVSIAQAYRFLSTGVTDVMIAGGSEACITECVVAGFNKLPDMQSNDVETMSRAFDKNSKGYLLGEAAGLLILETEEHAKARGASIYCELAGFAVSHGMDSEFVDGGMPTADALAAAINNALKDSGVAKTDVSYVSAHGSGVPAYDAVEAKVCMPERPRTFIKDSYDTRKETL